MDQNRSRCSEAVSQRNDDGELERPGDIGEHVHRHPDDPTKCPVEAWETTNRAADGRSSRHRVTEGRWPWSREWHDGVCHGVVVYLLEGVEEVPGLLRRGDKMGLCIIEEELGPARRGSSGSCHDEELDEVLADLGTSRGRLEELSMD